MIIKSGNMAEITGHVASGRLNSSSATPITTLGVILNGGRFTTFSGEVVSPDDVLVKFTYYGDADLSGVVDASDYLLADRGFLGKLSGWGNGDFNHDGRVNIADFFLMDRALAMQGGAAAPAAPSAAVPEPSTCLASGALAVGLLRRRRSR